MKANFGTKDFHAARLIGHKGQEEAKDLLSRLYSGLHFIDRHDKKWDFFVTELGKSFEVKKDDDSRKWHNLFLEFENLKGEPSGIIASESDFWIHYVEDGVWMFKTVELRKFCLDSNYPTKWGGKNHSGKKNAHAWIIPVNDIQAENERRNSSFFVKLK